MQEKQLQQLQTHFTEREAWIAHLREQFPEATQRGADVSPLHGGRVAAEKQLQQVDPARYAATRNMLSGAVTHLSPYLKQGILTLAEVRDYIQQKVVAAKSQKLLQELAWRDYYQRVYQRLHNDVWQDIEAYKTGVTSYAQDLPTDISEGTTGLACMDAFAHDLRRVGYLHNHARMWTAAYVVHHRRVRWQAGAYWFLQHLLDGDPASNNLSWQWVASTFAAKPYYFNQENLARYTEDAYCKTCPLFQNACPFAGSYEELEDRLFPRQEQITPGMTELTKRLTGSYTQEKQELNGAEKHGSTQATLVWINAESLNPYGPALVAHPEAKPVFIFDDAAIDKAGWTLKRIAFIYESLLEIPQIQIFHGEPIEVLTRLLATPETPDNRDKIIATTQAVDPTLQKQIKSIKKVSNLQLYEIEPFVAAENVRDLRRFSRYWNEIEAELR